MPRIPSDKSGRWHLEWFGCPMLCIQYVYFAYAEENKVYESRALIESSVASCVSDRRKGVNQVRS